MKPRAHSNTIDALDERLKWTTFCDAGVIAGAGVVLLMLLVI